MDTTHVKDFLLGNEGDQAFAEKISRIFDMRSVEKLDDRKSAPH